MTAETDTETKFSTEDMRRIFGIDESTWGKWRKTGRGPAFGVGGCHHVLGSNKFRSPEIYYTASAVAAWTAESMGGRWPDGGRFLNTRQTAKLLGITESALRQRRRRGQPPEPVYLEGIPRYLPQDCVSQENAK